MELIYLYIKQCENVFENVEFNFSSNYIATMKNNELLVKENQNCRLPRLLTQQGLTTIERVDDAG